MVRLYLSGLFDSGDKTEIAQINKAAELFRENGFLVFMPLELSSVKTSSEECLRENLKNLCNSDYLVLTDKWVSSRATKPIFAMARHLGIVNIGISNGQVENNELPQRLQQMVESGLTDITKHQYLYFNHDTKTLQITSPILRKELVDVIHHRTNYRIGDFQRVAHNGEGGFICLPA